MARPLAGQKADELELDLVGVLELVDHHQAEAPLEGRRDAGVVPHGGKGHPDQVVVVKAARLGLELAIARVHAAGELEEPRRVLGRVGEGDLGTRQGEAALASASFSAIALLERGADTAARASRAQAAVFAPGARESKARRASREGPTAAAAAALSFSAPSSSKRMRRSCMSSGSPTRVARARGTQGRREGRGRRPGWRAPAP